MAHEHFLRVRYAETDQMGVVHHANYVIYMEEARTAYMAQEGCPYGDLERDRIGLAVRRVDVRYRAPARYEERLRVTTRVESLRGASVRFGYELHRADDGTLLATGSTDLACIDLGHEQRPPRPLPEGLRRVLEPLVEPGRGRGLGG